jgi:Ca2+-dependent lipid-binding protein
MPVGTGQSTAPNLALSFDGSLNLSLWDYDSGSRDDLLGSITVEESELGNELLKKAASDIEDSIYYVHGRVY